MRRICVITGSRAEYGLLRWVMQGVADSSALTLQVVVTGMHLSPTFGYTWRHIEEHGFAIDRKVEMLFDSDSPVGVAKAMGVGMIGFADAYADLQPDCLVVLGDRFEILAAVAAALPARIPVVHLHGGEITEGAIDDAMRHAITKMSHVHFVAAEEYRRRVIQLGEDPARVLVVGALGLDNVAQLERLARPQLEAELGFKFGRRNLLVTFHPVTLGETSSVSQMTELLAALAALDDIHLIFTMPNADAGGRVLAEMVNDFIRQRPNSAAYSSLGDTVYLSCLAHVDGVVGNSSSGLIEAPALKKGTVNIGERQRGRLRAASVIDCEPRREAITEAIAALYSEQFQSRLASTINPYGEGGASEKIVRYLVECEPKTFLKKTFFNLSGVH